MDINDIKSILANEGDLMDSEVLAALSPSVETLITAAKTDFDQFEKGKVKHISKSALALIYVLETALETKRFKEIYYG